MILLNDFKRQWTDTSADVLKAVETVGSSGWYILGSAVKSFEEALARAWPLPYAIGVGNGLDAIEMSLKALKLPAGAAVLTSPISAFPTPLAIVKAGGCPVFVDCDAHGLIDFDACRKLLHSRPDIRYFVPVHLFGHSLDLGELSELRDRFELNIVEDCAQSIGATFGGQPTGSVGQFATTSFYPTKNLGALGDGGAVLTHTSENADKIRHLRDYGQTSKYHHDVLGYNSRLDELQAAILVQAFLPRLGAWIEARRKIAATYLSSLQGPALEVLAAPEGSDSSWHLFPALVDAGRKQELIGYLRQNGIMAGEHYPLALTEQKALIEFEGMMGSDCPRSREFCRREVSLPIHPYLSGAEIGQVVEACNRWC
jgi:dTDP-3-amino-3,4,6-trideoxy-alpha-D-glucose transaminase